MAYLPPAGTDLRGLTQAQLKKFEQDGYLVIESALPPGTVNSLMVETNYLLNNFSVDDHPLTKFKTGGEDGREHVGDNYFLESGDKVRFFFEEDAFDKDGKLQKPKDKAVNKIGHALHTHGPFAGLTAPPSAVDQVSNVDSPKYHIQCIPATSNIAKSLGFKAPEVLQSMIILKQPEIGGEVPPHQDSTFLFTEPPSAIGFWFALEDATAENGCLFVLPGSHKWAPISKRFVRKQDNSGTQFDENDGAKFPEGMEVVEEPQNDQQVYEACIVKAGSLILIHGNLLHKSGRNTSQKSRIAYTFHVIEGEGKVYDKRNWLQPPKDGFFRL